MIGILARAVVGIAGVAVAAIVGYGVYKVLTREKVIEAIRENEALQSTNGISDPAKAILQGKVTKRIEAGNVMSLSKWDSYQDPEQEELTSGPFSDQRDVVGTPVDEVEESDRYTFAVYDKYDRFLGDVDIVADELASDIHVGEEIILVD